MRDGVSNQVSDRNGQRDARGAHGAEDGTERTAGWVRRDDVGVINKKRGNESEHVTRLTFKMSTRRVIFLENKQLAQLHSQFRGF